MAPTRTTRDLEAIRNSVERIGRLSDSIVSVGPLSIGLDGVLSWVPGLGELYSAAAGTFIIVQGVRAGVPKSLLAVAGAMLLSRTAISAVPLAGPAVSDIFTAHKWSAKMIVRAIDRKIANTSHSAAPTRRARGLRPAVGTF